MAKLKYINQNKYMCCQLISAMNAAIYFGREVPALNSPEFERLAFLTACKHGACIGVEKAYPLFKLGAKYYRDDPEGRSPYDFGKELLWSADYTNPDTARHWVVENLPVEISVHCKKWHRHSVLIVAADKYGVTLANYDKNRLRYMSWKELISILDKYCHWPRSFHKIPPSKAKRKRIGVYNHMKKWHKDMIKRNRKFEEEIWGWCMNEYMELLNLDLEVERL